MNETATVDLRMERARTHFAKSDRYLSRNCTIDIRAHIVKQLLGDVRNSRLLDLGCGDGRISLQFLPADNHVTLVDLSTEMLERARHNTPREYAGQAEHVHSDVLRFNADAAYDVVFCIGVLAHVSSTEEAIAKVASCVKPGGRCIVQITDNSQPIHRLSRSLNSVLGNLRDYLGHSHLKLKRMSLAGVLEIASRHGLCLKAKRRHELVLFPGMRRLLGPWYGPYDMYVQNSSWLSRGGEDVILMLEKNA